MSHLSNECQCRVFLLPDDVRLSIDSAIVVLGLVATLYQAEVFYYTSFLTQQEQDLASFGCLAEEKTPYVLCLRGEVHQQII